MLSGNPNALITGAIIGLAAFINAPKKGTCASCAIALNPMPPKIIGPSWNSFEIFSVSDFFPCISFLPAPLSVGNTAVDGEISDALAAGGVTIPPDASFFVPPIPEMFVGLVSKVGADDTESEDFLLLVLK